MFLPYGLIETIEVKNVKLQGKMLVIKVKGFKRSGPFDMADILGDEGLVALHQMMMGPPRRQEAPELHIYGGRGLRVSSMPGTGKGPDGED